MKKIIVAIMLFIMSLSVSAFEITPEYFGHRIDTEEGFQEYTLSNNSDKTIRYRFSALPSKVEGKSMHEWVIFQPKFMTIKPGESKKLKVFAKSPKGTPIGDYAFYMYVQSVNIPEITKGNLENNTITAGTQVGLNIAIQMFGWVGDLPANVKLENYKIYEEDGKVHVKGTINNLTKKRFARYRVLVYGENKYEPIYGAVIFTKQKQEFDTILTDRFKSAKEVKKIEIVEIPGQKVLQTIKL